MSLDLDVEVTGPNETQHGAREAANEAHQYRKVWYKYGHQYGGHNDAHSEAQAPHFQLTIQIPDGRKLGLWRATEEVALEQLAGSIIWQWIAEDGLDDQKEVDHALKALRVQIIGYHLLRVILEGEKADVTEAGLEYRSGYVGPVKHPVELGAIYHVALERGQEYLRGVREDNDAQ